MTELSLTERAAAIATVQLIVEQANRSVRKHRAVGAAETAYRKACVRKFTAEGKAVQSALRPWRGALDTHAEVVASEALDPGPLLVVEQVDADDFTDAIVGAIGAGSAQLAGSLQARMPTLMAAGAASAQADTGAPGRAVSFDLDSDPAVDWLEDRGAELVAGIDETTRARVRRITVEAVRSGWSYTRTAQVLRATYSAFSRRAPQSHVRTRAELIAITEAGTAYEQGRQQFMDQAEAEVGIAYELRWIDARDEAVCPVCEPNTGDGWIARGESFSSGHPHPLAHPGCRCDIVTRVAD